MTTYALPPEHDPEDRFWTIAAWSLALFGGLLWVIYTTALVAGWVR